MRTFVLWFSGVCLDLRSLIATLTATLIEKSFFPGAAQFSVVNEDLLRMKAVKRIRVDYEGGFVIVKLTYCTCRTCEA